MATSADEAADIFTGKRWPLHVPPAPMPADERYPEGPMSHLSRPTAAWSAWHDAYRDDLLGRLAWAHGECMVRVLRDDDADLDD